MENNYTNGKTFWQWMFADKKNWLFALFFNGFTLFGEYRIHQSEPVEWFYYLLPLSFAFVLWVLTVRTYKQLKKGISK